MSKYMPLLREEKEILDSIRDKAYKTRITNQRIQGRNMENVYNLSETGLLLNPTGNYSTYRAFLKL